MPLDKVKIELLQNTIKTLERVRDAEMAKGGGHVLSDDIFAEINKLYEELLNEFGHYFPK